MNYKKTGLIISIIGVIVTSIGVIYSQQPKLIHNEADKGSVAISENNGSIVINNNSNIRNTKEHANILEYLAIYTNRDLIIEKFGSPIFRKDIGNEFFEEVYSFQDYYIQLAYDTNKKLHFFAISPKNKNVKLTVPGFNKFLGDGAFSFFGEPEKVEYSDVSSKFAVYAESHYFGNSGKYNYYFLAYNGRFVVDYTHTTQGVDWYELKNDKVKLSKFRKLYYPNSFGVSSGDFFNKIKWDDPWGFIVGLDYDLFHKLP